MIEHGINWDAMEPDDFALMDQAIAASYSNQRRVVAELSDQLEGSARLALNALRAIADAGFIITKKADR